MEPVAPAAAAAGAWPAAPPPPAQPHSQLHDSSGQAPPPNRMRTHHSIAAGPPMTVPVAADAPVASASLPPGAAATAAAAAAVATAGMAPLPVAPAAHHSERTHHPERAHVRNHSSSVSRSLRGGLVSRAASPLPLLGLSTGTGPAPVAPAGGASPIVRPPSVATHRDRELDRSRPSISSPTHVRAATNDDGDGDGDGDGGFGGGDDGPQPFGASPSANLTTLARAHTPVQAQQSDAPAVELSVAGNGQAADSGAPSRLSGQLSNSEPRLCLERLQAADALTRERAASVAEDPVCRVASPMPLLRPAAGANRVTPPSKRRQRQAWNSDSGRTRTGGGPAAVAEESEVTGSGSVSHSISSTPRAAPAAGKWSCWNFLPSRRVSSFQYAPADKVIRIDTRTADDAAAASPKESPARFICKGNGAPSPLADDSHCSSQPCTAASSPSASIFCDDRLLERLPSFLRRTWCGVRLLSWIYLVVLLCGGLALTAYLWIYFVDLVHSLTQDRFDHNCFSQSESFAQNLGSSLEKQEYIAIHAASTYANSAKPLSAGVIASLTALVNGNWRFGPRFSTVTYCTRVTPDEKSAFEAAHSSTILRWDAAAGSLRNATGTGAGPGGDFFPVVLSIEGGESDKSNGLQFPFAIDLASIPGLSDALAQMQTSRASQFGRPYFVANYSQPTRADGGDVSQPNVAAWIDPSSTGAATPAPSAPTAHSGFRLLMLSPVWNSSETASSSSLVGVLLSSFDLSSVIHSLLHSPHVLNALPLDLAERMERQGLPVWTETSTTRLSLRSASASGDLVDQSIYYERVRPSTVRHQSSPSKHYVDASDASGGPIHTAPFVSSWPVLPFLAQQSAALDWQYTCQAHSSLRNHFSQLDSLRQTLGFLVGSFVVLVSLLSVLLLRWHHAIFSERLEKSRYIAQMNDAIVAAETARDQKTDFMAFLCHELRNPLHAVLSMSDMLRDCQLDPEQTDAVFTIHASSELMLAITNDILDYSKIAAGKIELDLVDIDLYALIHSLVRANNSHAQERGITVIGRVDPRVPRYISADPTRVNQTLTNLLSNAVKFSRKHGEVRLEVELIEEADGAADSDGDGDDADADADAGEGAKQRDASVVKMDVADMLLPVPKRPPPHSPQSFAQPSLLPQMSGGGGGLHSPHTIARARLGGVLTGAGLARRPSLSMLNDHTSRNPLHTSPAHVTPEHGGGGLAQAASRRGSFSTHSSPPPPHPPGGVSSSGAGDPVSLVQQQHAKHARMASDSVDRRARRVLRPAALSGHLDMSSFFASPSPATAITTTTPGHGHAPSDASSRLRVGAGNAAGHPNAVQTPMSTPGTLMRTLQQQHNRIISSPSLMGHPGHALYPSPAFAPIPNERQLSPLEKNRRLGAAGVSPARACSNGTGGEKCRACDDCLGTPSPKTSDSASPVAARSRPVRLAFKVVDDGCGIPSESIPILFIPYTQAKRSITRSHGGTGLGLAIVKRLCDLMNATITVESELGVGTTFTLAASFQAVPPPSAKMAQLMQELPPALPTATRFDNYNTITTMDGTAAGGANTSAAAAAALHDSRAYITSPLDLADRGRDSPFVPALPAVLFPARSGSADLSLAAPFTVRFPSGDATVVRQVSESGQLIAAGNLLQPLEGAQGRSTDTTRGPSVEATPVFDPAAPPELAYPPPSDSAHALGVSPALYASSASSVDRDTSPRFKSRSSISIDTGRRRIATHKVSSRVPVIGLPPAVAGEAHSGSNPSSLSSPHGRSITLLSTTLQQQSQQQQQQQQQPQQPQWPSGATSTPFGARSVLAPSAPPTPTSAAFSTSDSDGPSPAMSPTNLMRPAAGPNRASVALAPVPVPVPVSIPTPVPAPVRPPAPAAPAVPKQCVLVVDDAAINRKIMVKMLGRDFIVDQAENGLEAVQMVEASPNKYCCVLLDLMMPVLSGSEALQQLRSRGHTALPIIACTANTMNEDVTRCMNLGFSAFLSKPCRKELVCATVNGFARAHAAQRAAEQQSSPAENAVSEAAAAVAPIGSGLQPPPSGANTTAAGRPLRAAIPNHAAHAT